MIVSQQMGGLREWGPAGSDASYLLPGPVVWGDAGG